MAAGAEAPRTALLPLTLQLPLSTSAPHHDAKTLAPKCKRVRTGVLTPGAHVHRGEPRAPRPTLAREPHGSHGASQEAKEPSRRPGIGQG